MLSLQFLYFGVLDLSFEYNCIKHVYGLKRIQETFVNCNPTYAVSSTSLYLFRLCNRENV